MLLILAITPVIGIIIISALPSQHLRKEKHKDIDKEIALITSLVTL